MHKDTCKVHLITMKLLLYLDLEKINYFFTILKYRWKITEHNKFIEAYREKIYSCIIVSCKIWSFWFAERQLLKINITCWIMKPKLRLGRHCFIGVTFSRAVNIDTSEMTFLYIMQNKYMIRNIKYQSIIFKIF